MMDQQIITAYRICSHHNYGELSRLVSTEIIKGWQPFNQAFVSMLNNEQCFHQTMVKYKPIYIIVNGDEEIITTRDNVDNVLDEIAKRKQLNKTAKGVKRVLKKSAVLQK